MCSSVAPVVVEGKRDGEVEAQGARLLRVGVGEPLGEMRQANAGQYVLGGKVGCIGKEVVV